MCPPSATNPVKWLASEHSLGTGGCNESSKHAPGRGGTHDPRKKVLKSLKPLPKTVPVASEMFHKGTVVPE